MGIWQSKAIQPPGPELVIAIDVGSFASGYALLHYKDYKTNNSTPSIYVNKEWGNQNMEQYKTPTALLIQEENDPNKDLFGQEAIETYLEADAYQRQQWRLFERFKLQLLHHKKQINSETTLDDSDGNHLSAVIVFSRFIKCLKNHALGRLERRSGSDVNVESFKWVITVPAIWPDRSKSLMRLAAQKADIPGANLVIAIEPECAAIQVIRSLSVGTTTSIKAPVSTLPGSVVMLVDMGGGTVDIILLEIIDERQRMKQVLAPDGGPWGGNCVDEIFFNFLREIIGEDVLKKFVAKHPTEFLELQQEFEKEKRKVCQPTDREAKPFDLRIPASLLKMWTSQRRQDIKEIVKNIIIDGKPLIWKGSRLKFPPQKMWTIFKETTDKTIGCIRKYIERAGPIKISAILAVGGLSCSKYVIHALKQDLSDLGVPVLYPEWDADLAVLKGAVLYGHDENCIVSRTMAVTYGLSCIKKFDLDTHSLRHIFQNNRVILANAVFQKIVTRGQTVKSDEWIDANVYYPNDGENMITIYVHASDEENPTHIDDESCWFVGKCDFEFSASSNNIKDKAISVSMQFGGTEITVKAVHLSSGKCKVTKLLLP